MQIELIFTITSFFIALLLTILLKLVDTFKVEKKRKMLLILLYSVGTIFIISLVFSIISVVKQNQGSPSIESTPPPVISPSPTPNGTPNLIPTPTVYITPEPSPIDSESQLLLEAEQAFEDGNFKAATENYMELETLHSTNPIVYNNLGYLYSNGLGKKEDREIANVYYKLAHEFGSKKATGNLLCLFKYINFSEEEYFDILEKANELDDSRVDMALENIYDTLELSRSEFSYSEDFFSKDENSQIAIVIDFFELTKSGSSMHTGTSSSGSNSWSGSSFYYEPPINIFDKQELEYVYRDLTPKYY
jgi:hypothetical protein